MSRRVRRVWPALVACVLVTSAGVLALDPFPGASLRIGFSSLSGLANINLYLQQLDYFAASPKFNALTHMWSLGVEEQFYAIFLLLAWLLVFKLKRANRFTAGFLIVLSLLAFACFYRYDQPAAYFLMPMRF